MGTGVGIKDEVGLSDSPGLAWPLVYFVLFYWMVDFGLRTGTNDHTRSPSRLGGRQLVVVGTLLLGLIRRVESGN